MSITKQQVEHTAHLGRLELSEEEKEKFTVQLSAILNYFEELRKVDTTNIEPTSHPIPMKAILREDEVKTWLNPEDILKSAVKLDDGFFRVPRILEQ